MSMILFELFNMESDQKSCSFGVFKGKNSKNRTHKTQKNKGKHQIFQGLYLKQTMKRDE
jgi:hypothetical protein